MESLNVAKVKPFDEEKLRIYGSLIPPNTRNIHRLDRKIEDVSLLDSGAKKKKDKQENGAFSLDDHHYVKKAKKLLIKEDQ